MAVDLIARGMAGNALSLAQNSATKRFVGSTALNAGNEQAELTNYDKNVTGGNPIKGDQIADTRTGTIWEFNGNTWYVSSYNPDKAQITINKNNIAQIQQDLVDYDTRITKNTDDITDLNTKLNKEIQDRIDGDKRLSEKDDDLQDQIDAISALAKGVKEVVGTHAEMELLDKTKLVTGDIINILADETRDGVNAYYRFNGTTYDFIGTIAPYYTKIETDNKLTDLKDTIDQEHQEKIDELTEKVNKKQNKLVAGAGIILNNDVATETTTISITVQDTTDTPNQDSEQAFNAGGAYKLAPTLNGQKVTDNPTFYAPETIGTEGQIISVDANGQLVWVDNEGGGGDVKGIDINGSRQPLNPDTKIVSITTDDTLTEDAGTKTLSVSKANIPITKADYEALAQAEREDESKVYLITDDTTDTPVVLSEIDDTDATKASENLTRSNKYITDNIETPLDMVRDWKVDSYIELNGEMNRFFEDNTQVSFYAPTTAGQEGEAVIMGADGKPTWGSASKVTLNGTETKDAAFYAPTTAGNAGQAVIMGDDGIPTWGDIGAKVTLNGTETNSPSFYAATSSTAADSGLMLKSRGANNAPVWSYPRLASMVGQYGSFTISAGGSSSALMTSISVYSNFTINGKAIFTPSANILNVAGSYLFIFDGTQTRSNSSGWSTYYYRLVPTDGSTVTIGQIYQSDLAGTRTCVASSAVFSISKPCYLYIYIVSSADHSTTHGGYGRVIYLGETS